MTSFQQSNNFTSKKKILVLHHWEFSRQRQNLFSDDIIYITAGNEKHPSVITLPVGSRIDIGGFAEELKKRNNWYPDLFIAKVDAFFNIVAQNVRSLQCPTVLILGDTQHGNSPLTRMIDYLNREKYDFYISDHHRGHLWFYYLAGIQKSFWLPSILINPPQAGFEKLPFSQGELSAEMFADKIVFIGQARQYHPRRARLLKKIKDANPNFISISTSQSDSLKVFNIADISLNISLNGDLNLRCLEIIAAGGMQISDRLSDEVGMDLLLKEDEDVVLFDNEEDLLTKIRICQNDHALNSRIRRSAHQRYVNEYAPEIMEGLLWDIIAGKKVEARYTSDSVPRIQYIGAGGYSSARIAVYEFILERHRLEEFTKILFDGRVTFSFPADFLDLPRLEAVLINQTAEMARRLAKYVESAPDAERLRVAEGVSPDEKFDMIVAPEPEKSLLKNLRTMESYIIYQDAETEAVKFLSKMDLLDGAF